MSSAAAVLQLFLMLFILLLVLANEAAAHGFVKTSGATFVVDGHPFYVNGFNAYWMPRISSDSGSRDRVASFIQKAAGLGLTVARTWAFNDGSYQAIQTKPGIYDEQSFEALDFVLAEAKKHGVKMLLSLSNNYDSFGGKSQYVRWAREAGISCSSDDAFFTDPSIKGYFKNYIHTVLMRVNTVTKVAYRDDTAIFAWELMNEPRVYSDPTGNTLEAWIQEMASFVKSIDSNHMLEVGMEGFYSNSAGKTTPGIWTDELGTDFIRHNQISEVDFATVHTYPDLWLPEAGIKGQLSFLSSWITEHIEDAGQKLRKPVLFAEFGKSDKQKGYYVGQRDQFLSTMYATIYSSARNGGAGAGALVWQLFFDGMSDVWDDSFQIEVSKNPSTARIIAAQSRRLSILNRRD